MGLLDPLCHYCFYHLFILSRNSLFDGSQSVNLMMLTKKRQYYFYDDVKNVRKNFFITYKGAMFEGEKYLGTTENSFDVVSIFVWVKDEAKLQGFTKDDFHFLQV